MNRYAVFIFLGLLVVLTVVLRWSERRRTRSTAPTPPAPKRGADPAPLAAPADVYAALTEAGFGGEVRHLEEAAKPCAFLVAEAGTPRALGSHLGGRPDLPSGTAWPRYEGRPLAFLLQLRLDEIPDALRLDLPDRGMLYFFYDDAQETWGFDPKDAGSFVVLYAEALPPSAAEVAWPQELAEHARFRPVAVTARAGISLPDPLETPTPDSVPEARDDEWTDLLMRYEPHPGPRHQVRGHAQVIQGGMPLQAQLVTHGLYCGDASGYQDPRAQALAPGAAEWRLLAQIDSDDAAGMMWGDGGRLYFWIREADLKARRFEKAWMIFECY